jgi:4-coumarate--CoA ligase
MTVVSPRGVVAIVPLFHITGLIHLLHLPALLNVNVYTVRRYTLATLYAVIQEYKIEEALLVPPILHQMSLQPRLREQYDLSSIKRFSSGAAPLPEEIIRKIQEAFPRTANGALDTGFKQGYGMTESCSCITVHPPGLYNYSRAHKAGKLLPSTEVRIVDSKGNDCGANQRGQIYARGPQIAMGYLENATASAETFLPDGFLVTGDVGFMDEEGFLQIVDRQKALIKVKGEQVSNNATIKFSLSNPCQVAPAELEDLLLRHEVVRDVAVMGIPDPYNGEVPKAFVVIRKKPNEDLSKIAENLMKYVQSKKVRYKWIKQVQFVEEIPRSAAGKLLKRELKHNSKDTYHAPSMGPRNTHKL